MKEGLIDNFGYWLPNLNKRRSGTVACDCGWREKTSCQRAAVNLLKAHRRGFSPDGVKCILERKG
jgi:hypothetical protein